MHRKLIKRKHMEFEIKNQEDRERFNTDCSVEPFDSFIFSPTNGNLLLSSDKDVSFKKGTISMKKKMKLNDEPVYIESRSRQPDTFIRKFGEGTYNMKRVGVYAEHEYVSSYVKAAVKIDTNKRKIDTVKELGVDKSIHSGVVAPGEALHYETYLEKKSKKDRIEENRAKELPQGTKKKIKFKNGKKFILESFNGLALKHEIDETIDQDDGIGVLEVDESKELQAKKKHYWFYSEMANLGKTTMLLEFISRFNGCVLNDPNNWINVNEHAHWIFIDEVGPTRKLPFDTFKLLLSGDASLGFGNCKTFGSSKILRSDAQFIIASNYSPWEIYGIWDKNEQRRVITKTIASTLLARLNIYNITGSDYDELKTYMNRYEFRELCLERDDNSIKKEPVLVSDNDAADYEGDDTEP